MNYEEEILNVNDTLYYHINNNDEGGGYCCYRENTITKKIYKRSSPDYPEKVIYDFSLQEGDSISYDEHWFYVDSIRSKTIFETERTFWYLRSKITYGGYYSFPIWIEGIASLTGIVYYTSMPTIYWMEAGVLTCYYDNDTSLIYQ